MDLRAPIPALSASEEETLRNLTREWTERAIRLWGPMPFPEVRFDLRGAAAGQYRSHPRPCIRYNAGLAALHFDAFCRQTPPHEVAHHVVACRWPGHRRPHGPEWQEVMRAFGLEPRRCHDFDPGPLPVRRQRRFRYRCDCREHELTATRHNRVARGRQRYFCRACGAPLRPV